MKDNWTTSDSRVAGMVLSPLIVFVSVVIAVRVTAELFYGILYLAMLSAVFGLVSGVWILFGNSSLALRSSAVFFIVINLMEINGVVALFQR